MVKTAAARATADRQNYGQDRSTKLGKMTVDALRHCAEHCNTRVKKLLQQQFCTQASRKPMKVKKE